MLIGCFSFKLYSVIGEKIEFDQKVSTRLPVIDVPYQKVEFPGDAVVDSEDMVRAMRLKDVHYSKIQIV